MSKNLATGFLVLALVVLAAVTYIGATEGGALMDAIESSEGTFFLIVAAVLVVVALIGVGHR